MAEHWLIQLPLTVPLSLNVQQHYMVRARKVRNLRDAVHVLALAHKIPRCQKIRVTVIYTPKDRRRRDSLNLAPTAKACEDGLVDARVVPDDTPQYVQSMMPLIDFPEPGSVAGRLDLLIERVR